MPFFKKNRIGGGEVDVESHGIRRYSHEQSLFLHILIIKVKRFFKFIRPTTPPIIEGGGMRKG